MKEILDRLTEKSVLLHPEAVSLISEGEVEESVLSRLEKELSEGTVVTAEMLEPGDDGSKGSGGSGGGNGSSGEKAGLDSGGTPRRGVEGPESASPGASGPSGAGGVYEGGSGSSSGGSAASSGRGGQLLRPRSDSALSVKLDATGESEGEGEIGDFKSLFRDRLSRLKALLERRQGLNPRRIDTLSARMERELSVVGMVEEVSRTSNDHFLIRMEDESGSLPALVHSRDEELLEVADTLLPDEVIGVQGRTQRGSDLLLVESIYRPEVPQEERGFGGEEAYAAFMSDVHVGSKKFMEEELLNFFSWLRGEVGNEPQRELASRVKYLVIAGDLVEGVGVYPGQREHLKYFELLDQYEEAAALLEELPRDVEVVLAPGNHDAVRQAEPQPALRDEYAEALEMKNLTLVSNPSVVELEGVEVMVYHGRSLDDLNAALPSASYDDPTGTMKELLKRRHLAPTYGDRTPLSPEKRDFLLIDEAPDVLHTGHIHTFGMDSYRGVTLINSGTWQAKTDFQERMGIEPTPGRVPLLNLGTGERKVLRFA